MFVRKSGVRSFFTQDSLRQVCLSFTFLHQSLTGVLLPLIKSIDRMPDGDNEKGNQRHHTSLFLLTCGSLQAVDD